MPLGVKVLSAVALAIVAGGALIGFAMHAPEDEMMALGKPLPRFTLEPIEGIEPSGFGSGDFTGRPAIINAFASWCIPCRQEHPLLADIGGRYDVAVLGMNVQDLPEQATAFLDELGNPYDAIGADPRKDVSTRLGFVGLPHTLVIDAEGRLLLSHAGPIDEDFVASELPRLLTH